jgi:sugar lactone lactonase YvrE
MLVGAGFFISISAVRAQTQSPVYQWSHLAGMVGPSGGPGSADGTGRAARFNGSAGIAVDSSGNAYVADTGNHTIRKITVAGVVTTLAGVAGQSGSADGTGSAARFYGPGAIAVDAGGNVYVADTGNYSIRKITPDGAVTTLAGTGATSGTFSDPVGIAVDGNGTVYVGDGWSGKILEIDSGGAVTTLAVTGARISWPIGVAVDGANNLYVSDFPMGAVEKITPAGLATILAGAGHGSSGDGTDPTFSGPHGLTLDRSGNVYVADNSRIRKITSAGVVTTLAGMWASGTVNGDTDGTGTAAAFCEPQGVAVDGAGNVYVADTGNHTIRKISPAAEVTTWAGPGHLGGAADGTGSAARFDHPYGVAVDGVGNVFVADTGNNTIRKVTPAGVTTTLAGLAGQTGSSDGVGTTARFNFPCGVAVDGAGNVYVADEGNYTIRKITADGAVTTMAGSAGVKGSADGAGSVARFFAPRGMAADSAGNVYVADSGNYFVRKITPDGVVSTLPGFGYPNAVAVNAAGDVYVSQFPANAFIGKITPAGAVTALTITSFYGVPEFNLLTGIAVDSAGNVFVADQVGHTICELSATGVVTAIGGTEFRFGNGDGSGSVARFDSPFGVAIDTAGNLYVADMENNAIRKGVPVSAGSPTISTQPSNQIAMAGTNVSFTCEASGTPAPTYRWQVGTNAGTTWTDLANTALYSGTTTGTLTITGVTTAISGYQYRCVASNGAAPNAISNAATLTVISADQVFLQQIFPQVLGREIDPGALSAFLAAMAGGRTPAQVYGDLIGSAEYAARQIEPVIRLYHAAFARMPDYAGLQNWSNALQAGALTLTGAADQFAGSAEFLLKYGALDNTGYVQQLYRNVLGREADPAGLADWVNQLNGGATRGTILVGFSESPEFQADMANQVEVIRLYDLLLQRMPTDAELQSWLGFLQGYDQTDTLFAQGHPSGLADADYVQLVFRGFLRRAADTGALGTFGSALTAGTVTHASLVQTLLTSTEFNTFVAPVSRLYMAAFHRVPDAGGLDNWVAYVRAGNPLQSAADAFVASPEFQLTYGSLNDTQYVTLLYENVLGREPDPAGLTNWTGQLASGWTRGQVLIGFSESQEGIALFAPTVRTFLHYFTFLNAPPAQSDLDYWKNYLATLDDQMRETMLADL